MIDFLVDQTCKTWRREIGLIENEQHAESN